MNFIKTNLEGLFIIEPKIFNDTRGYFFESFRKDIFEEKIGNINFVQDNESYSTYGSLRGLHYQLPPFAQSKLVRVVKGKVLDVAVDLRENSKTFGESFSVELSEENKKQFFLPRGFAHGFVTLSDYAIFQYKVDNYYSKESEAGIIFDDHILNIDWKVEKEKIIISEKDKILPNFKDAKIFD